MSISYLENKAIQGRREDDTAPTYGRDVTGYGRKIPTARWFKVRNRWRRVYVCIFSNSGSAFVVIDGKNWFLSPDVLLYPV
tara:strand:+ start:453 stop:695 length:243 start_codon:yes stop_codon:yes gene_type:complete